jgi:ribosome maturation factor RimP
MAIATDRTTALETLVSPTLDGLGYDLVRVLVSGSHQPTLQVMAERRDGSPMTVEDCEKISRALSAKLDVEDPIAGSYTLEVSSPGLDRPLIRPRDYVRFAGAVARVETRIAQEGQRRFKGRIARADDNAVTLAIADEAAGAKPREVEIAFANIAKARLVLTDEMLRASARQGR